ncbi:glycoside hydrolase family 32 protein [Echinicola jeungdonensis]|uniref:Glycoside hydrolase family 32 protein n=1 Tax=Echinicola jeungdonensis TaxID=709343 RepID=A0ABV5J441_9BACT|nr:glycoside hydrolase family 32 protein [Echinicola jeungdonensis]MDN3667950.1 glycoside hydrolase family 32 protein [Echinicola jeungdonensis]
MKKFTQIILPFFFLLQFACAQEKKNESMEEISPAPFSEKFRPQYHFTPPSQWMNDPNGMVYLDGEYHLFYQHYPDSNVWGPMHWGHAVSTDMVNWEHLPIALYPDSLGTIFSGSAVIDHNNTSGLGEEGKGPMVAIFTYDHETIGQTQGIAYSNDKGRTWSKFEGNPVLDNPGIPDFRDPKVSWFETGEGEGKWIMTLAVKDKISFYSSPDLINWSHESDFNPDWASYGGVWECPDLFALKTPSGEEKWVLIVSINPGGPNGGSATQYFIGNFDGSSYTADGQEIKWIDYGTDNYAGVTWSNIPEEDGRRLFIGWMSNWDYATIVPTYEWRSAMTLPRKLELFENNGEMLMASRPVQELQNLRTTSENIESNSVELSHKLYELELGKEAGQTASLTLSNAKGDQVVLRIEEDQIVLDRSKSGDLSFYEGFGKVQTAPIDGIQITDLSVYVDRSSVEFFFNNGERVMTAIIFPGNSLTKVDLEGFGSQNKVHYLESIWAQ